MSFILEALKKSENARQRQTGPGLASLPERVEPRRAGIWPWILGAVLMINAAVIAVVLFRDAPPVQPISQTPAPPTSGQVGGQQTSDRAPAAPAQGRTATEATGTTAVIPAQPPVTAVETAAAAGPSAASRPAPAGTVRSLAAEAQSADDTGTAGADQAPAATASAAPARAATPPQAAAAAAAANDNEIARMPSVQQLYLSGELTGPPLNLDLHVYFPQPSRRVVFISGTRYREGDSVGQGVTVKEIIPAGVILEKRGQSYLLQAN